MKINDIVEKNKKDIVRSLLPYKKSAAVWVPHKVRRYAVNR